jgi:hypothetical protein
VSRRFSILPKRKRLQAKRNTGNFDDKMAKMGRQAKAV